MTSKLLHRSEINLKNPMIFRSKYSVSEKDLNLYFELIQRGEEQEAVDEFLLEYIMSPLVLYTEIMQDHLRVMQEGEVLRTEQDKVERNIIVSTLAIIGALQGNAKSFIVDAYAPHIFLETSIESKKIQQSILKATLSQFEEKIKNAMSNTQLNVLTNIRDMQRRFIVENQVIRKMPVGLIDKEIVRFKKELKELMPDYYDGMKKGNILKSRTFGVDDRFYRYKLDDYAEMSMRTTLLNVDRTSAEVVAESEGQELVEYYQRDFRPLKSGVERQICKSILANKYLGKSLLAMNDEAASKYGVMSLQSAKDQGAMGMWCRHSIRSVSKNYMKKLKAA